MKGRDLRATTRLNCIKGQKCTLKQLQNIVLTNAALLPPAALCNNRSDNSKDWTFHVFPKNPCRRLISPPSTAHVHLL